MWPLSMSSSWVLMSDVCFYTSLTLKLELAPAHGVWSCSGRARPTLIVSVLMIRVADPHILCMLYTRQMMLAALCLLIQHTSTSGPAPRGSHTRPNPRREEKTVFCVREETRGPSLGNKHGPLLGVTMWDINWFAQIVYVTRDSGVTS